MAVAKVRDILNMLRRNGWRLDRQVGSHRHFRHPNGKGTVNVNRDETTHYPIGWLLVS